MIKIIGDTAEELADLQDTIIEGMAAKEECSVQCTFVLSTGNLIVTDDSYWKTIIGECKIMPDGSKKYTYIKERA